MASKSHSKSSLHNFRRPADAVPQRLFVLLVEVVPVALAPVFAQAGAEGHHVADVALLVDPTQQVGERTCRQKQKKKKQLQVFPSANLQAYFYLIAK